MECHFVVSVPVQRACGYDLHDVGVRVFNFLFLFNFANVQMFTLFILSLTLKCVSSSGTMFFSRVDNW